MTTNTRAQSTRATTARSPGTGQTGTGQSMGQSGTSSMLARGGSVLAASLLFLLGVYHFFAGIAGFARDNFYTVGGNYPYQASSNAWGWIHVIGGILLAATGLALFSRSTTWARPVAIALAVASAIANFFFLAYFPLWAILMIGVAVFCIWALARDGSDIRQEREAQQMMGAQSGMQSGLGTQQHAGQQGQQAGPQQREQSYVSSGSGNSGLSSGPSTQRWPENVGGRDESGGGRQWAPSDMKEGAKRTQEHAQAGARSAGQAGRSAAEDAANRARQSGNYRSDR